MTAMGLLLMYGYVIVGLELFNTDTTGPRELCPSTDDAGNTDLAWSAPPPPPARPPLAPGAPQLPCMDRDENFESVGHAMLALFQVSSSNNWNDLLYPKCVTCSVSLCIRPWDLVCLSTHAARI